MTPETLAPIATLIIVIAATAIAVHYKFTNGSNNATNKH